MQTLKTSNSGQILNRVDNLLVILTEHQKYKDRLAYNELTHQYIFDGEEIQDLDYSKLQCQLCADFNIAFSRDNTTHIAELAAKSNQFHPIKNYLNSLKWDGKDRITETIEYLNIAPSPINKIALQKWLIGAVARIFQPGCKNDSIVVFQGLQGIRKSSVLEAFMYDPSWFCDEELDFGSKDSKQILLGKWFVELSELSAFRKKENNQIKQELTHRIDEFRSPYDRKPKKYPRQFIYVGTTNDNEFLTDPTGNRRYWILPITSTINTDRIKELRDQIWAQAYSLYKSGEKWWMDKDQENVMAEIASNYEHQDAWHDQIVEYLNDKNIAFITTSELLDQIISIKSKQTNQDKNRVIKIMQFLKWNNTTKWVKGSIIRGWRKPHSDPKNDRQIMEYGQTTYSYEGGN